MVSGAAYEQHGEEGLQKAVACIMPFVDESADMSPHV